MLDTSFILLSFGNSRLRVIFFFFFLRKVSKASIFLFTFLRTVQHLKLHVFKNTTTLLSVRASLSNVTAFKAV